MRIEDDNGISDLLRGEETRLCGGFGFIEGPIWLASDNALVFSDIPGNRQHIWRPGESEAAVYRDPSGWSNGLTLDASGNLLACEHGGRRVSRAPYGSPGSEDALADTWDGKRLNSPNDLVVHSSGAIVFTDPAYGTDTGRTPRFGYEGQREELDFRGVYRIDPDGSLHCVAPTGFTNPNGLAFNPDESQLYIGDSQEGLIWRYEVNDDLTLGDRILFGLDTHADDGFTEGIDWNWLEEVLLTGVHRFPWWVDLGVDRLGSWWGYYGVTPDNNPVIGYNPGARGWVDACGFSGHGIMHAPATGLAVSELIADRRSHTLDVTAFRHGRFEEEAREVEVNIF